MNLHLKEPYLNQNKYIISLLKKTTTSETHFEIDQ